MLVNFCQVFLRWCCIKCAAIHLDEEERETQSMNGPQISLYSSISSTEQPLCKQNHPKIQKTNFPKMENNPKTTSINASPPHPLHPQAGKSTGAFQTYPFAKKRKKKKIRRSSVTILNQSF